MTPEQLEKKLRNPTAGIKDRLELIQQAKNEWCKEQRENCEKSARTILSENGVLVVDEDSIYNAPEP